MLTRGQLEANQPVDNYWVRANPNVMLNESAFGYANGINSAILRYDGAREEEPNQAVANSINPLFEYNLHPLTDPAAVRLSRIVL